MRGTRGTGSLGINEQKILNLTMFSNQREHVGDDMIDENSRTRNSSEPTAYGKSERALSQKSRPNLERERETWRAELLAFLDSLQKCRANVVLAASHQNFCKMGKKIVRLDNTWTIKWRVEMI